jgi:nitrite reductase/ring-hydroxylating ferredoxin subunit
MAGDSCEVVVARVGEVTPGQTKKFFLRWDGREEECFLVNFDGKLHAYINRCCHVPMTMDWIENQFLTDDKRYILCATHGACYDPDTGECVVGPPLGKFLEPVPLTLRGEEVIATWPPTAPQKTSRD